MGLLFVKTSDGKKKPSVWVWIFALLLILGASIFFVTNDRITGFDEVMNTERAQAAGPDAPAPIDMSETVKDEIGLDAEAINAMNGQIEREKEENNGWISQERMAEIKKKYEEETEARTRTNFQPTVSDRLSDFKDPMPVAPPPVPMDMDKVTKPQRFMTLAERLAAEGIEGTPGGLDAASEEFPIPERIIEQQKVADDLRKGVPPMTEKDEKMKNLLPMGTFIACILESDVITTDLNSHVWATVVLDVTFRRQMQLPKGLVRLRGRTAAEPVQNMVDIHFDVMLFSDGTELPINGFAYATFDPRYPNRFKVRGVPGEMIVPPLYVKLQGLVYAAALGASDAYIQNYINENTTQPNTFRTQPVIDPVTGQTSTVISESVGNPVNSNIGGTVALSAGQGALEEWVTEAKTDLEKYRPYVVIQKGTPVFVQLDETVDVSKRKVNGVAIAQAEAMAMGGTRTGTFGTGQAFHPADARARYSGGGGDGTAGIPGGIAQTGTDFFKQLQNIGPSNTEPLQKAQEALQNAQQSTGQSNVDLQQILQQMGRN